MIRSVLVANRAEIAARVFRTCHEMGIETLAVHSDADSDLPYVGSADRAVRLPGNAPADTYLRADLIIAAAHAADADAVHPGYGFLSENADFARAVTESGLVWIGPDPESIEQMGSKIESKRLMEAADVPVLRNLTIETATDADLPLIVKASAGGGGRGMRIVRDLADLSEEIRAASAEALSAFGDGTVFVETYVERGRHVEVQVMCDRHGNAIAYGNRDCSLQRRHQKVIEEAPAPGLPEQVAAAMADAAIAAACAVKYVGAGTVEFLYDPSAERFFFLEMNTRLQVEHPVTEEVFGIDLVAQQIRVAEGGVLDPAPTPRGHAIEVRLYAEDPSADYQPQSGLLTMFDIPAGPGIRVDAGFATGTAVSTFYDAMLAKVVCYAPTRVEAARRLAGVLSRARIHGVRTNRDQLVAALRDPEFLAAEVHTEFLTTHSSGPFATSDPAAPIAATLALAERTVRMRATQRHVPPAFRTVPSQPQVTRFEGDIEVHWWAGYRVDGVDVIDVAPDRVTLSVDGVSTTYAIAISGPEGAETIDVDGPHGHLALKRRPRFVDPADQVAAGSLLAPMPGSVVAVDVAEGETVAAGDRILVLEAMKMQHAMKAPADGTVTALAVGIGQQVAAGEVLAVIETAPEEEKQ